MKHGTKVSLDPGKTPSDARINEGAFQYYPSLRKIRGYVEDHYGEDISSKKAAQIACKETKYFLKFFHTKVGVTFGCWLRYIRLLEATRLMRTADYSITYVAHEVGFQDLRTFERAFKKYFQLTPREFKNSVRPDPA